MKLFYLLTLVFTLISSVFGWEPPKTAQEEMQDKWCGVEEFTPLQSTPENSSEQKFSETISDGD